MEIISMAGGNDPGYGKNDKRLDDPQPSAETQKEKLFLCMHAVQRLNVGGPRATYFALA
jgi:hypothetical protein